MLDEPSEINNETTSTLETSSQKPRQTPRVLRWEHVCVMQIEVIQTVHFDVSVHHQLFPLTQNISLQIDSRNIILEGKSYGDQSPNQVYRMHPYINTSTSGCILERTSFKHIFVTQQHPSQSLTFPLACFSGEQIPTSNILYHAVLYPKRVSTFQVRSTESDVSVSS
jgi:hypothetical protein